MHPPFGGWLSRLWRAHRQGWRTPAGDLNVTTTPDWLSSAHWYYSRLFDGFSAPVAMFHVPDGDEVSDTNPGDLCLRLAPDFPMVRVFDAAGNERGVVRSAGIVPGIRYVLRRGDEVIWTLSVRSLVRKRHRLEVGGLRWTFETPFFWWQDLVGTSSDSTRLVGGVGPGKRFWVVSVEPGHDTFEVLAAVAFLHRKWWQW